MSSKPVLIVGIVAIGALGVFFSQKLWKKEIAAIPAKGLPLEKQGNPPAGNNLANIPNEAPKEKLPPEVEKLNAMQGEIAKLSDEDIDKELVNLKKRAQESGILEDNVDINQRPELKAMLTRMALLRVEKAKRGKKAASNEP